jgi:hypothetical protein
VARAWRSWSAGLEGGGGNELQEVELQQELQQEVQLQWLNW